MNFELDQFSAGPPVAGLRCIVYGPLLTLPEAFVGGDAR